MSTPPIERDGSACEHLHLRYWASWIEVRDTFVPAPAGPEGIMVKRPGGGVWCPLCSTRWGHQRAPGIEADAVPRLPLESGAWAVFVLPDGSLAVEAGGALTDEEAEDLSDALRMAKRAAAVRRDVLAGRDRWRVERIKGATVLSRWHEGQQRAMCLGQVIPRKACSCDLCEAAIPRGALAWKADRGPAAARPGGPGRGCSPGLRGVRRAAHGPRGCTVRAVLAHARDRELNYLRIDITFHLTRAGDPWDIHVMSNATPADDFEFPTFELPARVFETRDLRGTGPRGTVRDDRLVADADNARARRPRKKR